MHSVDLFSQEIDRGLKIRQRTPEKYQKYNFFPAKNLMAYGTHFETNWTPF
jgi:hypothetical protein